MQCKNALSISVSVTVRVEDYFELGQGPLRGAPTPLENEKNNFILIY